MKTIYKITYQGKRYQFNSKKEAETWRESILKKLANPNDVIKERQAKAVQELDSFELDKSIFFADSNYIDNINDMFYAMYLEYHNTHVEAKPKLTIREEVVYETAGEAAL